MSSLVLSCENVNNSFFQENDFISIKSPVKEYRFCWMINSFLAMDFQRNSEMDINIFIQNLPKKHPVQDLFSETNKIVDEVLYFSVFNYQVPHSEYEYFIYTNKFKSHYLIPELKQFDYFMISPQKQIDEKRDFIQKLNAIDSIQIAKEISVM